MTNNENLHALSCFTAHEHRCETRISEFGFALTGQTKGGCAVKPVLYDSGARLFASGLLITCFVIFAGRDARLADTRLHDDVRLTCGQGLSEEFISIIFISY